jgi:DNA (cytosine-5)-methyltransferase 1
LFAGIGGFHYGLRGNKCVYSNEWDKYANSVYRKHFGECDNRDIRTVDADEIPTFDLLCGGFPCQSFSIAGKRKGFSDTRGTLFFEIARILNEKRPRLCLLENVKGLLSHDNGNTFKTIIATLDDLGYDLQWQVLNSKDFGVPQNRERIFIIGHLRGTPRPKVFPIQSYHREVAFRPVTASAGRNRSSGNNYVNEIQRYPLKFLQRNQKNIEGDYAFTVDSINTGGIKQGMNIRRLTPIECERLQGFPDQWTQYGADGELISDTQRYKMCGNAVTTNVITAIAERLI